LASSQPTKPTKAVMRRSGIKERRKIMSIELEVANRSFIDKRRSHLIDVYIYVSPHSMERVATYSTKTHSLTFYNFPLNYTRLWESVELFKQLFPIILKRSDEK